ncbi:thiol reductase thioredoxin [Paenibacillus sp. CAA11]|uniref:thioredoxin family protein n=1 Tax=Paenibacillus sp. CAA11 TaxID=1532905 RepID=UPI000D35EB33|nr:thioredoxin family protein [Paenibacillus sp. CAA11]AWB47055.1 thiol reductase thioredoxin [Paenibacillus sp. CAA11]
MKKELKLTSIREVEAFVEQHEWSFLYVSSPDCSTCHALLPKLRELLADYPLIHFGHVDASEVPEVAEKLLILSAPIMLLIIGQREYLREDRFVRFGDLREKLDHLHHIYNG